MRKKRIIDQIVRPESSLFIDPTITAPQSDGIENEMIWVNPSSESSCEVNALNSLVTGTEYIQINNGGLYETKISPPNAENIQMFTMRSNDVKQGDYISNGIVSSSSNTLNKEPAIDSKTEILKHGKYSCFHSIFFQISLR